MKKKCFAKRIISCIVATAMMFGGLQIFGVVNSSAAEAYTEVEWIYLDQQKLRSNSNEKFDTGVEVNNSVDRLDWELVASDFEKNSKERQASSFVGFFSGTRTGYFYSPWGNNMTFYFALGNAHRTDRSVELDGSKSTLVGGFSKSDYTYYFGKKGSINEYADGWPNGERSSSSTENNLPVGNIKVISAAGDDEFMSMRFYSLKIWKEGELVADLIPAKDSSGKAGIYNKVTGAFIGHTGNYDCGPEVNKPANNDDEHVHNFEWQIITPATKDRDGVEGEVCSICGARRNEQPLSAFGFALYSYALPMINSATKGQTVILEFGEWNSFPRNFMEKLAVKSAEGVTFVFHYKWNHVKQEVTIPAGTKVDLEFDWYGPAKMNELYPNTQIK